MTDMPLLQRSDRDEDSASSMELTSYGLFMRQSVHYACSYCHRQRLQFYNHGSSTEQFANVNVEHKRLVDLVSGASPAVLRAVPQSVSTSHAVARE